MTVRILSRPARLPWLLTSDHNAAATLLFEDENGDALDLSDATFEAWWAPYAGSPNPTAIAVDDSAAASGQLILTVDDTSIPTTSRPRPGAVWWLTEIVDGEPRPLYDGPFEVAPPGAAGISVGAATLITGSIGAETIQVLTSAVTGPVTTASGIDGGTPTTEGDWFLDGGTP